MPGSTKTEPLTTSEKVEKAWKLLPHIWALMRPRRWLLALGFVLMVDQPRLRPGFARLHQISG